MAEFEKVEFEFPDEIEAKQQKAAAQETEKDTDDFEIEVEDDTPVQDRNRSPLPKEIVDELESDTLDDYSDKVKIRLKQMKKITMACVECKERNYITKKNRRNDPDRLELKKFCPRSTSASILLILESVSCSSAIATVVGSESADG